MNDAPPLAGLRVLELASGIAGPYAGRLLAMLGATVVKVEPEGGDPARAHPVDDRPLLGTSPLHLHLDAGKIRGSRPPLDWADVVIDDRARSEVAGSDLDPERLRNKRPNVIVSITPWGFDAPPGGSIDDELLVQAASGICAAAGDEDHPRRFPGWQSQYMAGAYAAAGALAALAAGSRHVDVAWVTSMVTGAEALVSRRLHTRGEPRPADPEKSGVQVAPFPAGVFRCADGHVVPGTVRPVDWTLQCQVYGMPELTLDPRFKYRERNAHRGELLDLIQPWYDSKEKREIFHAALDAGWAAAMVMTACDALSDEHLSERGFLTSCGIAAPWRAPGLPATRSMEEGGRCFLPALDGLRVLELTRAWAGPFVGRFLGAFGADVVKLEAGRSPDGWRARLRWADAGVDIPKGADPEGYTWDAAALYNGLNRNKRGISVDLTQPGGRLVALQLVAAADLMVVNMTARALDEWRLTYDVLAKVNPRLVLVNMPALGATGPYRSMPGYGILIEGMGGFAARFGEPGEGAQTTETYYPDAVAGIHATVAALSGLAHRERTGKGCSIDLSQQEVLWCLFGEALVLASLEGRDPERMGDGEPGRSPSGLYPTRQGWIALVIASDEEFGRLVRAAAGGLESIARWPLARRLAERARVDEAVEAWMATQELAAALSLLEQAGVRARAVRALDRAGASSLGEFGAVESLTHAVTGTRDYLRIPLRVDGVALSATSPAPLFDEHTDEVLAEWGQLTDAELDWLRAESVTGTRPGRRA